MTDENAGQTPPLAIDDVSAVETAMQTTRIEDFISMQMFVPSQEWIMKHVVSQGRGHRLAIARLVGICRQAEMQINQHQGKDLESIKLTGDFEAECYLTGELIAAEAAYLPKMWGRQILSAYADGKNDTGWKAEMVLTLGVEATGKTIPYRWTVSTHLPNAMRADLARLKAAVLPRVPGPAGQARLALDQAAD